jgi:ribose transport system substrate-binding protein
VYASPWAGFKPPHGPPWKIGMSNNEGNLNADAIKQGMEQYKSEHPDLISKIVYTTPPTPNDVATQIQQMRSLVQQHVDLIISTLGSPTALNAVIDQAAAQKIPVISLLGQSTDKNAVNLQPNPIQLGYFGAKGLVTNMGGGQGKNVLIVDGIPGLSIDTGILQGGKAVLKACGVNIVGQVTGKFDPAIAKTQVLSFLASHPGKVDGVFQVSNMAPGIFSAFKQVGRPVPPVDDIGAPAASLAYWRDNKSTYKGVGVAIPAAKDGVYSLAAGIAMLQGRGVELTDIPYSPPVITADNLDQWVKPDWTTSTNALADGPPDAIKIDELLNTYFSKPAPK